MRYTQLHRYHISRRKTLYNRATIVDYMSHDFSMLYMLRFHFSGPLTLSPSTAQSQTGGPGASNMHVCLPSLPPLCPSHLRPTWRQYWAAGKSPCMKCFSLTKFVRSLDPMPCTGPVPPRIRKHASLPTKSLKNGFYNANLKSITPHVQSLSGNAGHGRQSSREPFSFTSWNFAGVIPKVTGIETG